MGFYAVSETSATSPNGYFGAETRADATLNFINTIAWQGISSVTDGQGNPVVEFELTSDSLTDWRQPAANPVPVPAAVWLFGSGLLGLIGVARGRFR
jgi:hypothetical protein